jgi:sugar/nucleoside kinase (ribokinase family)
VTGLLVIGNVSRDETSYSGGQGEAAAGGAALLVSLGSTRAGLRAGPLCLLGDETARLPSTTVLKALDWSAARVVAGPATTFRLVYDQAGNLTRADADYGVADELTAHALDVIGRHSHVRYHVCCRRPLDVERVLAELVALRLDFTLDFYLPSAELMMRSALPWLAAASNIFVNSAELRLLHDLVEPPRLREVVVTDGPREAHVLRDGQPVASVLPPPVHVRDVTGAGDIFTGTYLAHRARGATPTRCLTLATTAASRHIATPPIPIPAPRRP